MLHQLSMAPFRAIVLLLAITISLSGCSLESGRKELKDKEVNKEKVMKSFPSFQSSRVDPSRVTQLSWRPRVFLYRGLLSDEECNHLISLAQNAVENLSGSSDESGGDLKKQTSSLKTQINMDDTVARIEERISAWTFLPKENSKPLHVSRYGLEEAKQNLDYFGDKSTLGFNQPLMASIILYLSNITRGGEIIFPNSEEKSKAISDCAKTSDLLRPAKGNAILFFNRHPSASPDKNSFHTRCPVHEEQLWVAAKFFQVNAVNKSKKTSTELDDGGDCTDEDESCLRWAASGECQRNPVFMIGSPDYYGTCRKSCNAC